MRKPRHKSTTQARVRTEGELQAVCESLPGDYTDFAGNVERSGRAACGGECHYFVPLAGNQNAWGVCVSPFSPRAGMLTAVGQAGAECFTSEEISMREGGGNLRSFQSPS